MIVSIVGRVIDVVFVETLAPVAATTLCGVLALRLGSAVVNKFKVCISVGAGFVDYGARGGRDLVL